MLESAFKSILGTQILLFFALTAFIGLFLLLARETWSQKKHRWQVGLILLLGVALRVWWIWALQPVPQSDFAIYWQTALDFHQGDLRFMLLDRHPGLSVLYAFGMATLGASLWSGWLINLLLSVAFMLAVYQVASLIFGEKVGRISLLVAAILPRIIFYTPLMGTELPGTTFFMLAFWAILAARRRSSTPVLYWVALGFLLYGAVLIRSSSLLLLGLIPLVLYFTRRDQLKVALQQFAVMAVTCGVLVSTWVYHQYLVTGQARLFFGTETWLAFASHYPGGGGVTSLSDLPYYAKYRAARSDDSIAAELRGRAVIAQEVKKIILQDPLKYLQFGLVRMQANLWRARAGVIWSAQSAGNMRLSEKTIRRLTEISTHTWRILLLLSPLGLLGFRRRDPVAREGLAILCLFSLAWALFHYLLAPGSERYAYQILPMVLIFSVGGVQEFTAWLNTRKDRVQAL